MKLLTPVVSSILQRKSFCDSKVGGGSGGDNVICGQRERADDVIHCVDAETFRDYTDENVWVVVLEKFEIMSFFVIRRRR